MTRKEFMTGGASLAALSALPTFGREEDPRLAAAKKTEALMPEVIDPPQTRQMRRHG